MKLDSPHLNALVDVDMLNPEEDDPMIKKADLRISQLSPEMHNVVQAIEALAGQNLPRDGEDILLEMWGRSSNLQINGWDTGDYGSGYE